MAAGQGFKTFVTGDVLTAADTNGYLMQGVWVFANAAARTAAVTSPQEGNASFLKDTNALEIYDGAAWVAYGSGDITGVTAGTGISGGGTAGDVTITNTMATAIDAKGDLIAGTGADTFSRLAVGSNNTVLTADSSTATGLKWATPTSGSMTSLASGSLSSSSVSLTSISGSYRSLRLVVLGMSGDTDGARIRIGVNGSTSSIYVTAEAAYASNYATSTYLLGSSGGQPAANTNASTIVDFYEYTNTSSWKMGQAWQVYNPQTTGLNFQSAAIFVATTSAITSIQIQASTGNFDAGTYVLYGVN